MKYIMIKNRSDDDDDKTSKECDTFEDWATKCNHANRELVNNMIDYGDSVLISDGWKGVIDSYGDRHHLDMTDSTYGIAPGSPTFLGSEPEDGN